MVVAHSWNQASDAVYGGAESERTAMAGASRSCQHRGYIAAIDEKAWAGPLWLGRAVKRFPTRMRRIAQGTARVARVMSAPNRSVICWSGAGLARCRPPPGRQGWSFSETQRSHPEELRRTGSSLRLFISNNASYASGSPLPDLPIISSAPKIYGCLRIDYVYNILGASRNPGRVTSRGIVAAESAYKRQPTQSCDNLVLAPETKII